MLEAPRKKRKQEERPIGQEYLKILKRFLIEQHEKLDGVERDLQCYCGSCVAS